MDTRLRPTGNGITAGNPIQVYAFPLTTTFLAHRYHVQTLTRSLPAASRDARCVRIGHSVGGYPRLVLQQP
jgi:hypothetical protein